MTDVVDTTRSLDALCERLRRADFVAVDTEFMRERTYWPKLCLVQVAGPEDAVAIDPLVPDIDLAPLFALLSDAPVLKVFHAARQDMEVLYQLAGRLPAPLFDTQIAAMVCGLGDSISYEALAAKLAKARVDKSARFTDWSHRPLTKRQLRYAIDDVRHLRTIYARLARRLEKTGRAGWVAEEMAALGDASQYEQPPEEAWRRIKARSTDGRFLAVLRELAAWRENRAQERDLPRNWVLRDEALVEIAAHRPETAEELARTRGLARGTAEGPVGRAILSAIERGRAIPESECPRIAKRAAPPRGASQVADLLRVLLKLKCDEHGVAPRLVATTADLERIAGDEAPDVPAMRGWRREIFGSDAVALKQGRLALAARGRRVKILSIGTAEAAD